MSNENAIYFGLLPLQVKSLVFNNFSEVTCISSKPKDYKDYITGEEKVVVPVDFEITDEAFLKGLQYLAQVLIGHGEEDETSKNL